MRNTYLRTSIIVCYGNLIMHLAIDSITHLYPSLKSLYGQSLPPTTPRSFVPLQWSLAAPPLHPNDSRINYSEFMTQPKRPFEVTIMTNSPPRSNASF